MSNELERPQNPDPLMRLAETCGSISSRPVQILLQQIANSAVRSGPDRELTINAIYDMLSETAPKGAIETMLTVQMIATHFAALNLLRHATDAICPEDRLHLATKLMKTFTEQMAALQNNRRKGRQEIRVEHVNITGGQNILGPVTNSREGDN